jgi:threonine/homoserine/homoserine lactone efflux protein
LIDPSDGSSAYADGDLAKAVLMNWQLFSAFFVIAVVLYLTPGPIVTLVVTTGARQGVRAALMTVAGGATGNAALLACIALGLSWILKTSAEIFDYLRWIGAAYLIWLGMQAWRHADMPAPASPPRGRVHAWRGFIVALTNPKSIAFFTAFLPQFIDPALPVEWQLLVMCVTSVALGAVLDAGWAIAAGLGRAWFLQPKYNRLLGRLSGAVLIGGGVWLSLARRSA